MKIIENLKCLCGRMGNGKRLSARTVAFVSVGIATAAMTVLVGPALATPGVNIVSATILARASFVDAVDLKLKLGGHEGQEVIHAPASQDTVMQQIVIGPLGSTGWHSHHGPAVVLVTAGELTIYPSDDPTCIPRTYVAGEAFVDPGQGHVHMARNLGSIENTEVWVTYFDVPPGESVRLDRPDPGNCGF